MNEFSHHVKAASRYIAPQIELVGTLQDLTEGGPGGGTDTINAVSQGS